MTRNSGSKYKEEIAAFHAALPKNARGHLIGAASSEWRAWLADRGYSYARAMQIVSGRDEKRLQEREYQPFSEGHAEACIAYLERHGYRVIKPAK